MNPAESKKAQNILPHLCKELLSKAQEKIATLLDGIYSKAKTSSHSNEKLLLKSERVMNSSTNLSAPKQIYDIVAPSTTSSKKTTGSMFGDSQAFRAYINHVPTARNAITLSKSGLMAIVDKDHLNIYSLDAFSSDSGKDGSPTEKLKVPPITKIQIGFFICSARFNEANDSYIAVAGVRDCTVVTIEPNTGKTISKLQVNLMLQAMGDEFTISKILWIPHSQVQLAVAAHLFVKVYDLSADNISPLYTLTSMDDHIKDIEIVQDDSQESNYHFFVLAGNTILTTVLDSNPKLFASNQRDSNIQLVESVSVNEQLKAIIQKNHTVSLYYANKAQMLFLTLGNGKIIYGELDSNKIRFKTAICVSLGEDLNSQKHLFNLQEVEAEADSLWMVAMSQGSQLQSVLFRIDENETQLQQLKPKTEGIQVFNIKKKNAKRILIPSDDAYLTTFSILGVQAKDNKPVANGKPLSVSKFLEKSKLPESVTMPIDYFEKLSSVTESSLNLTKKIKINGSICRLVGEDNNALIEWLVLGRGGELSVGIPPVSFEITLESNDYIFAGFRIIATTAPKQNVVLFNRKIPLISSSNSITDVPLCDAEILSIESNTLCFNLEAEETAIKLRGVEMYVIHKDSFGYQEKVAKLEKYHHAKSASKDEERKVDLSNTKIYQVIPWLDKEDYLSNTVPDSMSIRALISCLDYYSSISYASEAQAEDVAYSMLTMLSDYIYVGIEEDNILKELRSSARKCAKAIIYNITGGTERIEGDFYNYYTYKSQALFKHVKERLKCPFTYEMLEKYLKSISNLSLKARLCFFEMIQQNVESLVIISQRLSELMEQILEDENATEYKARIRESFENYMNITVGYLDLQLNISWKKKSAEKQTLHGVIDSTQVEALTNLMAPYLLTQSDEVRAIVNAVIPDLLKKRTIECIQTFHTPVIKKYKTDLFKTEEVMEDLTDEMKLALQMSMGQDSCKEIEIRSFDFNYVFAMSNSYYILPQCSKDSHKAGLLCALQCHLLRNFQQHVKQLLTLEPKCEENWSILFSKFMEIAIIQKNPANPDQSQSVLLALKMFNQLFNLHKGSEKNEYKRRCLDLDLSIKLLLSISQCGKIISWISDSLSTLFALIKEKALQEGQERMQDIGDKKSFLKVRNKVVNDLWEVLFPEEDQQKKMDLWENIEGQLLKELCKMAYYIASYEQIAINKLSKPLGFGLYCSDKLTAKELQVVKGIKDIICEILLSPSLAGMLDNSAKKLFNLLSKSKSELHQFKDNYVYNLNIKEVKEAIQKQNLTFEQQVSIFKQLTAIWRVANNRPGIWKQYVRENMEVLKTMFTITLSSHEKIAFQALALVCIALEKEEFDSFHIKHTYEAMQKYPAKTIDIVELLKRPPISRNTISPGEIILYESEVFSRGIEIAENLSLNSVSLHMRIVAAHLLRGLWDSGNQEQKKKVLDIVAKKIHPEIFKYGCASLQILSLCLYIFQGDPEVVKMQLNLILQASIDSARKAAQAMMSHENKKIYKEIQSMISTTSRVSLDKERAKPDGASTAAEEFVYCLEHIPCEICIADIGEPYVLQKIGDIREDAKFNDNSYIYKLTNSYCIQKVLLSFDLKGNRKLKSFDVYVSSSRETDLSELKNNWGLWRKAGSQNVKADSNTAILEFPIPITSSLILIEFIVATCAIDENPNVNSAPSPSY